MIGDLRDETATTTPSASLSAFALLLVRWSDADQMS